MNDYPIYNIVVDYDDDRTRMTRNSFVDQPAVGFAKFAFNEQSNFVFSNDKSEQMFMGVSILADTPIPRVGPNGEKFYVVFSKETIRTIFNKFVMEGKTHEVTLNHDKNKELDGVYMVENFISEKGRVESPLFDVPDGSLITTYWVKDGEKYNELLNDSSFNGFSIELDAKIEELFSVTPIEMSDDEKVILIKTILDKTDITNETKEDEIKTILGL